jgi:hypothetical protein
VSRWLSDRIAEEAGRRIYESQQSRLSDQTTFAAKRAWRSDDVPEKFWDSYVEDARAALSLTSIAGAYIPRPPWNAAKADAFEVDLRWKGTGVRGWRER